MKLQMSEAICELLAYLTTECFLSLSESRFARPRIAQDAVCFQGGPELRALLRQLLCIPRGCVWVQLLRAFLPRALDLLLRPRQN